MSYEPPTLTVSFSEGSYADCLANRRRLMAWIAFSGIAYLDNLDGTLSIAYRGAYYSRGTITEPLESGWAACTVVLVP